MQYFNDLNNVRGPKRDIHQENLYRTDLKIKHAIHKITTLTSKSFTCKHAEIDEFRPLKALLVEEVPYLCKVKVKGEIMPCVFRFKNGINLAAMASTVYQEPSFT